MIFHEVTYEREESLKSIWIPVSQQNMKQILGSDSLYSTYNNDQTYNKILRTIETAKETIFLSSFIIADKKLENLLVDKSKTGVRIYILTSTDTQLSKMEKDVLSDFDQITLNHHRQMLDKFAGKILCRSNEHLHAKFLMIDPVINGKYHQHNITYISTANFASKPLKESPELIVRIEDSKVKYNIYLFFLQGFWNEAKDELLTKGNWSTILRNKGPKYTKPDIALPVTMDGTTSLRKMLETMISSEYDEIILSAYTFELAHSTMQQLLNVNKDKSIKIITRDREVNYPFFDQIISKFSNLEIVLNRNIHAKFILIRQEKRWRGLVFTANFTSLGLDSGYEIGIELDDSDIKTLLEIFNYWKSESEFIYRPKVLPEELAQITGHKVKELTKNRLQVKSLEKINEKVSKIPIRTIDDFLKNQNNIPSYRSHLFSDNNKYYLSYRHRTELNFSSPPKSIEKSKEKLKIKNMKNRVFSSGKDDGKKYIKVTSWDELVNLGEIADQISSYILFTEDKQ